MYGAISWHFEVVLEFQQLQVFFAGESLRGKDPTPFRTPPIYDPYPGHFTGESVLIFHTSLSEYLTVLSPAPLLNPGVTAVTSGTHGSFSS